jgi:hypothetical protein
MPATERIRALEVKVEGIDRQVKEHDATLDGVVSWTTAQKGTCEQHSKDLDTLETTMAGLTRLADRLKGGWLVLAIIATVVSSIGGAGVAVYNATRPMPAPVIRYVLPKGVPAVHNPNGLKDKRRRTPWSKPGK